MKVVDRLLMIVVSFLFFFLQVGVVKSKFLRFEWLVANCLNRALGLG